MPHDLVLRGGRVVDPSQNLDRVADVAFANGRVAAIGENLSGTVVRDVSGRLVTPGLIDLHTHVYWGGTALGVDPDDFARRSAVSTCVDAGSAGPGNFAGLRAHVIERAEARILVYLHISFAGIFGFARNVMLGESHDIRLLAAREAVEVANANKDVVIGIKMRIGRHTSGPAFRQSLFVATQVMSTPKDGLAVVDCGHKGIAIDSGLPLVFERPGVDYVGASDEHGTLRLGIDAAPLRLGETLRLVPGHCDPTVDRHDWYVGVRDGRVEFVWPVAARGMMG